MNDIKTTCWHFFVGLSFVCLQNVSTCSHHIMPHIHRSLHISCIIWSRMLNLLMPTYLPTKLMKKKHGIYFLIGNPYYHDQTENHIVEINCAYCASLFDVFLQAITITFVSPCRVAETSSSVFQRKKRVLYWSLICQNPSNNCTVRFHNLVFSNSIGVFTRF